MHIQARLTASTPNVAAAADRGAAAANTINNRRQKKIPRVESLFNFRQKSLHARTDTPALAMRQHVSRSFLALLCVSALVALHVAVPSDHPREAGDSPGQQPASLERRQIFPEAVA